MPESPEWKEYPDTPSVLPLQRPAPPAAPRTGRLYDDLPAFCKLFIFFGCQVLLRCHHDHSLKRIVQQVISDELFKISILHLFLQEIKGFLIAEDESSDLRRITNCPGTEDTVHQALWCRTVICLAVLKLKIVHAGQQTLAVDTLICQLAQVPFTIARIRPSVPYWHPWRITEKYG